MKKILLLIFTCYLYGAAFAQHTGYWQQQVDFNIDVTLDDAGNSLDGFARIHYRNNSGDTMRFIWFHLWPNAYKNDRTAFSDQLLENGNTSFYFSPEAKRGYINRLDFKVDGITASTTDHPRHQDIIRLNLPSPLPPNQSVDIQTPFHVKLPYNFSRGGYIGKSFQATQWYPKPAVYDRKGWHLMPYLDQGEFYSEFGNYDVQITLPQKYTVASTGTLYREQSESGTKTLRYRQDNIHDFAWFADTAFVVAHDTLKLESKTIDVYAYYHTESAESWKNAISFIKSAIRTKSVWIGEYPYPLVSVVESPEEGAGGMEYPTITLISTPPSTGMLDNLVNHEVGHNWFYGILASNEREYPWMDEGMNSYYDNRYTAEKYGSSTLAILSKAPPFIRNRMPEDPESLLLSTMTGINKDQPISTPSEKFSWINYNAVAYTKTAQWMELLASETGTPVFDKIMKTYYERWHFKHPYPEDFKQVAEEVSGRNLDSVFALLDKKGDLQKQVKKGLKVSALFSLKGTTKSNQLFISPAIGFNNYDKFMVGGLLHNYTLPVSRLQFVIAPLYATGSKQLNGTGRLTYNMYPGKNGQKLELAAGYSRFNADSFADSTGTVNYLHFSKLAPSIKYVFANRDPRSTMNKYIQWKTFFIRESTLKFERDSIRQLDIITYPVKSRYVNQLQFVVENSRVLYPYRAVLQAEQGKGFLRFNFTGSYFFNYAQGGGMKLRLFAGKFIYTGDQTYLTRYETDRYHLNMTGPKGYEDYTYSNYYIGRNDFRYSLYDRDISLVKNIFRGAPGQQIMERDGFFKVRTDLLSSKVGKTDDWLCAINLTTNIPKKINPLELLPVKIPLKIFADIGTYAEAWDKESATSRFLFDAGLQLSLFRDILNIYMPVFYSKVYNDYFKSTIPEKRFLKNISFSIDLQNATLKKLVPQSPL